MAKYKNLIAFQKADAEIEYLLSFSKKFNYIKEDITEVENLIEVVGKIL